MKTGDSPNSKPKQSDPRGDSPEAFVDVFRFELKEIKARRRNAGLSGRRADPSGNLVGLALSGGGIRSATFCLGLLQGLREQGLLRIFDYLSTVSGGGYVGGWWSAWLARPSLGVADLKNPRSFVTILKNDNSSPYSVKLRSGLSPSVRALLSDYGDRTQPSDLLLNELLCELTDLLSQSNLRDDRYKERESEKTDELFKDAEKTGQFFWANRALLRDFYPGEIVSGVFPPPEGIEPSREHHPGGPYLDEGGNRSGIPKAARETASAWADPIHHLRLYANYLTPRRGLFSSDTWRAIAVATRNITMTWLVLLPMLVAVVLAGQLYFVFLENPETNFFQPTKLTLSAGERRRALAVAKKKLSDSEASDPETKTPLQRVEALEQATTVEQESLIVQKKDDLRRRAQDEVNVREKAGGELTPIDQVEDEIARHDAQVMRAWFAAKPLLAIAGWVALMGIAWLYFTVETIRARDRVVAIAGTGVVGAVIGAAIIFFGGGRAVAHWWLNGIGWHITWLVAGVGLLAFALRRPGRWVLNTTVVAAGLGLVAIFFAAIDVIAKWQAVRRGILANAGLLSALLVGGVSAVSLAYMLRRRRTKTKGPDSASLPGRRPEEEERQIHDLWRNQITLVHAKLLAAFVMVAVVLAISGFGHEIVSAFRIKEGVWQIPREVGTWIALVASIFGSLFTVFKVRPRGGEDRRDVREPNVVSRAIFALTPPLVVVVLAVLAAWAGHSLLARIEDNKQSALYFINILIAISAPLYFMLAVSEMGFPKRLSNVRKIAMVSWLFVPIVWVGHTFFKSVGYNSSASQIGLSVITSLLILTAVRLFTSLRSNRNSDATTKEKIMDLATIASFVVVSVVCDFGAADQQYSAIDPARVTLLETLGMYLATEKFQHVWLVILPLLIALLVGGLVFYRWMVIEESREPRRTFRLARFNRWTVESESVAGWPEDRRQAWRDDRRRDGLWRLGSACVVLAFGACCFFYDFVAEVSGTLGSHPRLPYFGLALCAIALATTVSWFRKARLRLRDAAGARPAARETQPAEDAGLEAAKSDKLTGRRMLSICRRYITHPRAIVAVMPISWLLLAVLVSMLAVNILGLSSKVRPDDRILTSLSLAAILLCFTYIRFEMRLSSGTNRRSLFLITCAYVTLLDLLTISFIPNLAEKHENILYAHAVIGLMATALAWVVGLGWMADPNAFSMHAFYKARLARAYMGASNIRRSRQRKQITEPSTDDDLPLRDLRNTRKGAPYHLINTTLNLVAARDLATAQRSAASFVLSRAFCGSSRTGYRSTAEFMGGSLTLGTAVAISGAAASPNMGTRTPSAALAMLMTMLNVRLGYWAPTPYKPFWRNAQTRLWPFYLSREFLSHTNELSDYCYLTDGGHFDNTGLYSLVERGCRFIVVADCGADPKSTFSDLGEVIRRCRIDFRAEIKLDLSTFIGEEDDENNKKLKLLRLPFIVGSIEYSAEHLAELRKAGVDPKAKAGIDKRGEGKRGKERREGTIILFKPSVTAGELADVWQYQLDNPVFPQQSTTNQWFGEAQFESYRRLGEFCAQKAFHDVTIDDARSRKSVTTLFRSVDQKVKSVNAQRDANVSPEQHDGSRSRRPKLPGRWNERAKELY